METNLLYSPHQAVGNMCYVTDKPLNLEAELHKAHHPQAGGVVLFSGEVRNHNHGKSVSYLEYETHAILANKVIGDILSAARSKWHLQYASCMHRYGKLQVGESAVVVVTASPHRKDAYDANQYIIHRVKHEAPIWKKEVFTDGTHGWGNNCHC